MPNPRGTQIAGWWAWWPCSGLGRRFETQEAATEYIPVLKGKDGVHPPLGEKWVMRVAFDFSRAGVAAWSYDQPVVLSQKEVEAQFMRQGEAV